MRQASRPVTTTFCTPFTALMYCARSNAAGSGLRSWLKPEIDKWGALIRAAGQYAD